ncbi:zinc-ribbon domain-containing protein [Methanobrevibacter smithii]
MQFCPNCGRKLDDDATFCSGCGFDINLQQLNHQIMRF